MKKEEISYKYDPRQAHLLIYVDGKLRCGFKGVNAEKQFLHLLENDLSSDLNIIDMSESIRKAKVKRLRALWIKQGIDDMRDAILEPYGVKSTADLNEEQLDELLIRFNPWKNSPPSEFVRNLRSDILVLLNKLGVYNTNKDWADVNNFMMNPRIAGKPLYMLSGQELEALRRKLNSILTKQEKYMKGALNPNLN